ncbi:hypothetical protein PRCB_01380 [Pantoea rodasii]|uniref:Uncharacterized protein n=1 Tax=Pantoea rodasii TaxID=1076549 RepID=A0A2M9WIH0_9GAMM|nr:hypothetical protein PRCB_01380 [Pantoea rodasii]
MTDSGSKAVAPPHRGIHSNVVILAGRRNAGCLPVNEVQLPSSANLRWLLADAPPHRGIRSDFENVCGAGCLPVNEVQLPSSAFRLVATQESDC